MHIYFVGLLMLCLLVFSKILIEENNRLKEKVDGYDNKERALIFKNNTLKIELDKERLKNKKLREAFEEKEDREFKPDY